MLRAYDDDDDDDGDDDAEDADEVMVSMSRIITMVLRIRNQYYQGAQHSNKQTTTETHTFYKQMWESSRR